MGKKRFSAYHEYNPLSEGMTKELFFERSFLVEPSETFEDLEKMNLRDLTKMAFLGGLGVGQEVISHMLGQNVSVLPRVFFSWGYSYSTDFVVRLAFSFCYGTVEESLGETGIFDWAEQFNVPGLERLGSIFDERSSFEYDPRREIDPFLLVPATVLSKQRVDTAVFPCFVTPDLFLVPQTLKAGNLSGYLGRLATFYLLVFAKHHNVGIYMAERERAEKVGKTKEGCFLN